MNWTQKEKACCSHNRSDGSSSSAVSDFNRRSRAAVRQNFSGRRKSFAPTLPLHFKKIGCIPRKIPHRVHPDIPPRLALLFRGCNSFSRKRRNMTQIYFHYSNTEGVLMDRGGAAIGNLAEACEQPTLVVRSLIMAPRT